MQTQNYNNPKFGSQVDTVIRLLSDLTHKIGVQKVVFVDDDDKIVFTISSELNKLMIQFIDIDGILLPVPTDISQLLTTSFNQITSESFQIIIDNITQFKLEGNEMYSKSNQVVFKNGLQDLDFRLDLNSQSFNIWDQDTQTIAFKLDSQQLNVFNKQLLGVLPSTDLTSAINLQQLQQQSFPTSQITGLDQILIQYRLDQFLSPNYDLDMNQQRIINLPLLPIHNQEAASKYYVDTQSHSINSILDLNQKIEFFTLDFFQTPLADIDMSNWRITDARNPLNGQDAATKVYADTFIQNPHQHVSDDIVDLTQAVSQMRLDQFQNIQQDLDMGNQQITDLESGGDDFAVNLNYFQNFLAQDHQHYYTQITNFGEIGKQFSLSDFNPPSQGARIYLRYFRIINLGEPTNPNDAITRQYVDSQYKYQSSLTFKLDPIPQINNALTFEGVVPTLASGTIFIDLSQIGLINQYYRLEISLKLQQSFNFTLSAYSGPNQSVNITNKQQQFLNLFEVPTNGDLLSYQNVEYIIPQHQYIWFEVAQSNSVIPLQQVLGHLHISYFKIN